MTTSQLRFGIRLPPCAPAPELASAAVRAEELGFDSVWLPDSQLLWRDAFVSAAFVAMRTERIALGIAVTNPITRHASVLASATRTVVELAPGRFVLGIGVGNSALAPIGRKPATRIELNQTVEIVRALLRGDHWTFDGTTSRLEDPAGSCPLYIAASGRANLAFAGAVADGVILLSGVSPSTLAPAIETIRDGAISAGRDPADVDIVVSAFCHITDDVGADAVILKPICAALASGSARQALSAADIEIEDPGPFENVEPDLIHARDWAHAVAEAGRAVTDEQAVRFAQSFCFFGAPKEICAKIDQIGRMGARSIYLQHVGSYDLPERLMVELAQEVLPNYARATPAAPAE